MSETEPRKADPQPELDPVYVHASREAIVVLVAFFALIFWSVGVCFVTGYYDSSEMIPELKTVWGIPHWVFWGILVPWMAANVFSLWFCTCYMRDDDLSDPSEDADREPGVNG